MKTSNAILLLTCLLIIFASCKDKDKEEDVSPVVQNQVELTVEPFYDNLSLNSPNTIFTTNEGYKAKLLEFKFILTNIHNGNNVMAGAAIYDRSKGSSLLKTNGTSANFGNLSFDIGVDSSVNHSDPSAFPNDYPLNIVNASDMHWSWNPGYIFVKIEMIADTLNDSVENFDTPITYHLGMDDAFQQKELTNVNWSNASQNLEQLHLKINFAKLLSNGGSVVDIKNERMTHSAPAQMPLTIKLSENFKAALSAD